jgi:hypothetical protein
LVWEKLLLPALAGIVIEAQQLGVIKQALRHCSGRYSKKSKSTSIIFKRLASTPQGG